jgi:hypothetical protein
VIYFQAMKPLLAILLFALTATAQTSWKAVAFSDTTRLEIYGAEPSPTGTADFITVWVRSNHLRLGKWHRGVKVQLLINCAYGRVGPVRIGKANTHSAPLVDHIYTSTKFEEGSLGWHMVSASCDQVYGGVDGSVLILWCWF